MYLENHAIAYIYVKINYTLGYLFYHVTLMKILYLDYDIYQCYLELS